MARKTGKRKGYSILSGEITKEYTRKGMSKKRASYIGHATAGIIAHKKQVKRTR